MSYLKIWIHLVFSTKNREPYLTNEIRQDILEHIKQNCRDKDIFLKAIGGYTDHVHCLVSLGKEQTISQIAQLIKGESSFWINKNKLSPFKFAWQDDYFAVSVSHSQLDTICNYIEKQEEHHREKPFAEEVEMFMNKYGFEIMK